MDQEHIERNLRDVWERLCRISGMADTADAGNAPEILQQIMAQAEAARVMLQGACEELPLPWSDWPA
jgi:hypothetical protein